MSIQNQPIYRLDGIEVDPSRVCLIRDGEERHVRQKTFQVLIYLLEQRHRLITKDELIEHVWPDTAVTDNALEQCLAEIRKVLGDDSRHPRFIKTVPRAGYRFIGTVEEVSLDGVVVPTTKEGATGDAETQERSSNQKHPAAVTLPAESARKAGHWIRKRAALTSIAAILIAAAAITIYLIQRHRSLERSLSTVTLPQTAGKRPVAVMFFDNQSDSADLDWLREGLADMLITDLSNSKQLTVLSRQQLHLLLERIGHRESEQIKLDEALDVARRSQAKIVVLGSFAGLGGQIRIDVHLHDARDGQLLAAERLVVEKPGEILTQIDLLSLKLASYLGAAPPGQEVGAGLTSVMTENLEAYRYYSLAVEKAQGLHNKEAIQLLERAIALDPEFAMAYARIGYVHSVSSPVPELGKPYLEKAFQLSHRLSERDKLNIAAWYAIANFDYSAAINAFRQIISHYPLEVEAYSRLARLLHGEERLEEALEVTKQGLVIDPGAKDLYNALGGTYSDLGRHDEAIAMCRRYVELGPEEPNAHDSLGMSYQWAGRYDEAIQEYQQALSLNPEFEVAVIHLGNTYFQRGQYQDAIAQYARFIQIASSDFDRARGYNSIAFVQRMRGRPNEAERAAKQATKYYKTVVDQLFLGALERGDVGTARKFEEVLEGVQLRDRGARGFPRQLLYIRGYFDLKSGQGAEAIENLKEALKHRALIWNADPFEDCLANAYLALGRWDEAIAEYERILRLNPNYPLAQYHLGQAYERKGQRDQARASYERFLQIWKDADADVPEVICAKKALSS